MTCPNLSPCSLKSFLAGFVFSALKGDFSCCSINDLLALSGDSCLDVFIESAFCGFLFLGVLEVCFLGVLLAPLFPLSLLEFSVTCLLLKQLAITNVVGLHLNSSFLESSLHGNSSTSSWSAYRSFRFGRIVPSQPLYETLLR